MSCYVYFTATENEKNRPMVGEIRQHKLSAGGRRGPGLNREQTGVTMPLNTFWTRGKGGGGCRGYSTPGPVLEAGDACWVNLEGQARGTASAPFDPPTGAKRNAPSGPSASSAPSAVTATTGASAHPPPVPASVSLATKAPAARSGCAPRACTARAAPCPAPVTRTTPSGTNWGWGGPWWREGLSGHRPPPPTRSHRQDSERAGTSATIFADHFDEKQGKPQAAQTVGTRTQVIGLCLPYSSVSIAKGLT